MSRKKFKMEDWANMIYGSLIYSKKSERITDERPIPDNIKSELKGIWNGGTTNKNKEEIK